MIKGLFTAAASMVATQRNLDVVTNNLANVGTTGFKRKEGVRSAFPELMMSYLEGGNPVREIGSLGTGVYLEETYTDFSSGNYRYTGNDLDFALEGDAFFRVMLPEETILYTKNGNFTLNEVGQLVTEQGYPVMGVRDQPLTIIPGEEIKIDGQGQIHSGLEGSEQIAVTGFDNPNSLLKQGGNLYTIGGAVEEEVEEFCLKQFYLEDANVNIVEEMVKIIEKNRLYEANQKTITGIDENLGQAVNEIARLR